MGGFQPVRSPDLQYGNQPFCLWRGRAGKRRSGFGLRAQKSAFGAVCRDRPLTNIAYLAFLCHEQTGSLFHVISGAIWTWSPDWNATISGCTGHR